jgi:hypothetical protein
MKSPADVLLGRQTPRVKVTPLAAGSDGADVVDLCAAYGLALDPWQAIALEAGLAVDQEGQHAADTVAVVAPRQSGKGCLIEARALAGVLLFGEKVIACSAHEARTTRLSFERVLCYFDGYDDLRQRVKSVQRWVGREQIKFTDGSLIVFPARSRGALRGYSCDALILDEAQYVTSAQYEAILPTLSARPNTQTWMLGTVPTHVGDGEVLGRIRAAALSDNPGRLTYLEWSAEPGCDLDDRQAWADANPALGHRISLASIEQERRELSPGGFARERLALFPTDRTTSVFDVDWWRGLAGPGPANGTPPSALAVDAGPDRAMVVAAAWKLTDGRTHVEILAVDHGDPLLAQQLLLDRARRRIPVVIDGASAAVTLAMALQAERVKVVVTSVRDMAQACGRFLAEVEGGRISHAGQAQLDDAIAGARKRPLGNAGQFGWDRKDGSVFVSPLVAATLAVHGAGTVKARTGRANFA